MSNTDRELDTVVQNDSPLEKHLNPAEGTCTYAGTTYGEGSRVCQGGEMMECRSGAWIPTGETC